MRRFFGSANSRYFTVLDGREMSFFRQDTFLWKREIDLAEFEVLALTNSGRLFVLSPKGLYIWPPDPDQPPLLLEHFSQASVAHAGTSLGQIRVGTEGTGLCAQLVTPKSGVSDKLSQLLYAKNTESGTFIAEFLFFDIQTGKQVVFHRLPVPPRLLDAQVWNISRNFHWMVFAESTRSRNGIKISVVDVADEVIQHDFTLQVPGFRGVYVNNDGTVLVDFFHQGEGHLEVVTLGQTRNHLTPPSSYDILHLGRTYVAIRLSPIPHVLFKDFHDGLIAHADLSPLEAIGMDWDLHFDERDEIDLLTRKDGKFRIVHSTPTRIGTDSRRWEYVARHHRSGEKLELSEGRELEPREMAMAPTVDESVRQKHQTIAAALKASAQQIKRDRDIQSAQVPAQVRRSLESLKMQFATGQIDRAHFESRKAELEGNLGRGSEAASDSTVVLAARPLPPTPAVFSEPGGREKAEALLEALEEKFILGNISESTYLMLREKYLKKFEEP